MDTMEDLEKAAQAQGVSFEDFKANIRNSIITQEVMRQEVGRRIQFTPGEVERFFEEHKQDYVQPESVRLSEILISTGTPAPSSIAPEGVQPGDPAKLAAAKAKADDIEAKLHAGGDFAQLAKSFSDGPTAASGGDLGQFRRGSLAKVLEEKTFALNSGEYTQPIRTKQGYVILDVVQHIHGGVPAFKDVEPQVEEAYYTTRMEPAIRDYLTKMRIDAYIEIKPGYSDTGASAKQTTPVYSAYTPPAPKKKKKVERTRFRENVHSFRQKGGAVAAAGDASAAPATAPVKATGKSKKSKDLTPGVEKPGKKEKIRYGQKPRETLPSVPNKVIEDAGALPNTENANTSAPEPINPLEAHAPTAKSRYSTRAKQPKQAKPKLGQPDALAPAAPDAAEVADRQTQSGPLGLGGDTASKKKKTANATGEKKRLSKKQKTAEEKQSKEQKQEQQYTPLPTLPGAPAPADHPAPTTPSK
jgi:peptidyl-prolyl cis-trans isomerase SurA